MKVGTLSQMGADDAKSSYASRMCFFFRFWLCFVVLQVTVFNVIFQWSVFGELVSVMKQKPCCSIDNLDSECEF
jgi:hypothetical protein